MIENVFLDPTLIAHFLNEECAAWSGNRSATADQIEAYWNTFDDPKRYTVSYKRSADPIRWHQEVHGAHVLESTITELTNSKVEYRKIVHGRKLEPARKFGTCSEHFTEAASVDVSGRSESGRRRLGLQ